MQSTLTLPCECRSFEAIETLVKSNAEVGKLEDRDVERLLLAVDEVWRRMVEAQGMEDGAPEAQVGLELEPDSFTIYITDEPSPEADAAGAESQALEFARSCVDRLCCEIDAASRRKISLTIEI